MDLLEGLECVKELARQKRELEKAESDLQNNMNPLIQPVEVADADIVALEPKKKLKLFALLELGLSFVLDKFLDFFFSYLANDCMTQRQSIAAGYISYRLVDVFWFVSAILAVPLALILMGLILKVIKAKNRQKNSQWQDDMKNAAKLNREIREQNNRILELNARMEAKIREIQELQGRIEDNLEQNFPWYPSAYFSLEIVDYAIYQIQNGYANSLQEALVHYEAGQD